MIYLIAIFWLAETAYFGFNRHPSCRAEAICDTIVLALVLNELIKLVARNEIKKHMDKQSEVKK